MSELIENCGDIDTRHSYANQKENAFDSVYKDVSTPHSMPMCPFLFSIGSG